MRHFRNQSYRSAQAVIASFEACVAMAIRGEAHPLLSSLAHQRNGHGWTLLTVVANRCSPAGVKVVLAAGADPLATNRNGQTALQYVEANPPILRELRYGDRMAQRAEVIALLMHAENVARNTLEPALASGQSMEPGAHCGAPDRSEHHEPHEPQTNTGRRPMRAFA